MAPHWEVMKRAPIDLVICRKHLPPPRVVSQCKLLTFRSVKNAPFSASDEPSGKLTKDVTLRRHKADAIFCTSSPRRVHFYF